MAITTINGKLAIMELEEIWTPGIPITGTGTLGQDDKQQFLWGFPDVSWLSAAAGQFVRIVGSAFRLAGEGGLAGCLALSRLIR